MKRQTAEHRRAFANLRTLASPHRFRVHVDSEGFPVVPGRYGQVEWFDGADLAVYSDRPKLFGKLWAIPGVRRHQTGDTEMRAVFPPEALEQVAGVIRAKRRRRPNAGSFSGRGSGPAQVHLPAAGPRDKPRDG